MGSILVNLGIQFEYLAYNFHLNKEPLHEINNLYQVSQNYHIYIYNEGVGDDTCVSIS